MRSIRISKVFLALTLVGSWVLSGCSGSSTSSSQITTPPPPPQAQLNSIVVQPLSPVADVGTTVALTATGFYSDGSSKNITTSVNWIVATGSVAAVNTSGVATALNSGSTQITATSKDPSSSSVHGSTTLSVAGPTSITVTPGFPAIIIGGSQSFAATGIFADGSTHDLTNFVDWTLMTTPGTVTLSQAGVAVGNARGVNWICATSGLVTGSTYLNVTDKAFNNASLSGAYAFTLTSFPTTRPTFEVGSILADGNGNIVSGVEDINASTVSSAVTLSGKYSIFPDGRGTVTLTSNGQSRTFRIVLNSNSANPGDNSAQLLQTDLQGNAIGTLEKQDASSFANADMANTNYVFRMGGFDASGANRSAVGTLAMDAQGINGNGVQDLNDNGAITANASITESTGTIDATTGRALSTMAGSHFAMYMVSATKMYFLQLDSSLPAIGTAEKQTAASLSDGGYAFQVETGGTEGRAWMMGQFNVSGANISGGVETQSGAVNIAVTGGSLTLGSNGRGTLLQNTDHGFRNFIAYVVSPQKMYLILNNDPHAASGVAEFQQAGGSFSLAALNGDFSFGVAQTGQTNLTVLGQFVADGKGNITGVQDLSQPGKSNSAPVSGTYAVSASGQGSLTLASPSSIPGFIFYVVSPSKVLLWGNPSPNANGVANIQ
ncbi:MAG TPA: Ig-like domain-containing protein [Terriglobales bacterium]|nr:Ig-like domain-containing protein [Terriglobales bacterium]